MDQYDIIGNVKTACSQYKACRIRMKGESEDREIHPYGICFSKKKKLMVVGLQVQSHSGSGNTAGFRNLLVENCEHVEMIDSTFTIDKGFNPSNPQYGYWLFHVEVNA